MTRDLYRASQAGVRVDLIVRDTCRLRPGIPGLSDQVRVVSVVGRFLEHARIFYFRNGGDEEYFIGSADCMKRNLESRVEVVAPVEADNRRSVWDMQADGSYVQRRPGRGDDARDVHSLFADLARQRLDSYRRRKPGARPARPGRRRKA